MKRLDVFFEHYEVATQMFLLFHLFGEEETQETINNLKEEIPNMDDSYYIRNTIRTLSAN